MSDAEKRTFTDHEALAFHRAPTPGKISVTPPKPMATQRDLSLAYSPGVAVPVIEAVVSTGVEGQGNLLILGVDMTGVEFCDSTGMNVLLAAQRRAREDGGDLQLAAPRSAVRKVLQVTGLESVFTVLDSPAAI